MKWPASDVINVHNRISRYNRQTYVVQLDNSHNTQRPDDTVTMT